MATTIGKISEQAKRLIKGGNPSVGSNVWTEEVREYIGQIVNGLLKTEYIGVTLPSGESIPAGHVLASYDNIQVEEWKNRSRAKLPAIPVMLPRNMGVYHVGPNDDPDCFFIPVQPGQGMLLKNQLINDLLTTTYEVRDGYVITSKVIDVPLMIQLVVMDISKYGEFDLLPIPADMEKTVVDTVVARYSNEPRPDKVVDSGSEPSKIQSK